MSIRRQDLECKAIANNASNLSYFVCGYCTIIQNPNENKPRFYLLMSEKGFLCYGGGVVREEREGKLFYKLVLQLDLLTQDPQTFFLSSNKPIKFPNSSFGSTFSSVSKISHLWVMQNHSNNTRCTVFKGKACGKGEVEDGGRGKVNC